MKLLVLTVLQAGYFALGLFGIAAWLQRRGVEPVASLVGAIAIFPAMALVAFWLAWALLPYSGVARALQGLTLVPVIVLAVQGVQRGQARGVIVQPLGIMVLAGIALVLWTHGWSDAPDLLRTAASRWTHALPGDNAIPLDFAVGMDRGAIPRPLHSDWLSSDRPPLQTALFLVSPGHVFWGSTQEAYQAAAVPLQMLVLAGVWLVVYCLTASIRMAATVAGVTFFTPLVLVNGAFVWPKLLAATFLLVIAAVQFTEPFRPWRADARAGAVTGLCATLAMLSHPGSFFGLVGLGLAAVMTRQVGSARYVLAAVVAALTLYIPWVGYQTFVDPPGNRLAKWHLAGVVPIDDRTLRQAIGDAYRARPAGEYARTRWQNVTTLYAGIDAAYGGTATALQKLLQGDKGEAARTMRKMRDVQFFKVIPGTGLMGLALFALPVGLLFGMSRALTLAIIGTLTVWTLSMHGGGATIIHQGSLFPEIALIIGASVLLAAWRPWLLTGVGIAHAGLTALQYAL